MANNSIFMRFPNGLSKALTLSYDDAVVQDVRLIEIMKKHGLKGTFNISSSQYVAEDHVYPPEVTWGQRMTKEQATALYGQDGIEPALHAYTHAHLELLPSAQVAYEVIKNREELEEQYGHIVRGMAYPYGTFTDETVDVLKSCGVAYCRTIRSTERFRIPTDLLRLDPTCHHANPRLPEITKDFITRQVEERENALLFYLWGHAYEFERDDNWEIIERFAAEIGGKEDIWYATNIELYEYIESHRRLIFSLDQTYVKNPTAQDLWFVYDYKTYCIKAGETLKIKD